MPVFTNTLRMISGLTGSALRTFALTFLLIEVIYGFCMVALASWIASDGSHIRGLLAGGVVIGLVNTTALLLSFQAGVARVIQKAIKDHQIGKRIFDSLFAKALSGNELSGQRRSVKEVENLLNQSAKTLLKEDLEDSSVVGFSMWLAKRIQRITLRATIRVVIKTCSTDGQSVSLIDVRDKLANIIDQTLLLYFKDYYQRIFFITLGIVTSLTILICIGIRQLPL